MNAGMAESVYVTGAEAMRILGKTNRRSFRSWQAQHGVHADHFCGNREYFLLRDIRRAARMIEQFGE